MTEEFVSEVKQIPHNDERIFTMLSDLSNLERIKDRIPQDVYKRQVHNVRRHLETFLQAQLRLQVLTLAFRDPVVIDLRDTRTLLQLDLQPNLVALDLRRQDLHIRKQAMFPKTLHCCSDLLSRYGNLIAYRQAREADQHKIIILSLIHI